MKNLIFLAILLTTFDVLGQSKTEAFELEIISSWKFQSAKLKGIPDKFNWWGTDTVEFRNDNTLTFYTRDISYGKVIRYHKLVGTWDLKSDLKTLIVTIENETVEMPFKFKGKDSIQISHPVMIEPDPNLPKDHPNFRTGPTRVRVTYKKIGNQITANK